MILIDILMKPVDSYWRTRYHAEEIRRRSAEADLNYYRDSYEEQEKDLHRLSERDIGQYHAIETMTREIARLKDELEKAQGQLRGREQEISLLHEALRTERAARETMKMNAKLWEQIKGEAMERVHE